VLLDDLVFRRYSGVRELLSLVSAGIVEATVLRPLSTLWRARGCWNYLRGVTSWGKMERKGLVSPAQSAQRQA